MFHNLLNFSNLSVTWKLVTVYLLILAVSLSASGWFLYDQLTRSSIAQSQNVTEQNLQQMRESMMDKVNMIEHTSRLFTSDIKLQTFLGDPFTYQSYEYEEYRSNIIPFVENIMRQNPYIHSLRIYMNNKSIPEVYDSFYSIDRIMKNSGLQQALNVPEQDEGWLGLHLSTLNVKTPTRDTRHEVFSYYQKINSIRYESMVGIMEIEVVDDVLLEVLNTSEFGEIMLIDQQGTIISEQKHELANIQELGIDKLPNTEGYNKVMNVQDRSSIVISVPIPELELRLVGIYPVEGFRDKVKGSARTIIMTLIVALTLLGIIVFLITTALLSRLKVLVKAMKQVREGSLTVSVPVTANDEFTQIATSFNMMTGRIHDLVETVYKSQLMEREAELRALESQVNPHFLYNTLATIAWVGRKYQAHDVVHISNALAKFYRLMLNKGKREMLVRHEIDMVQAYLSIQKFRFEDRFEVIYDIDEKVYEYSAAKNLLQPIVENALIHGIEPKRARGTLIIKAGIEGDMLYYKVIDDGVGMAVSRVEDILQGRTVTSSGSGYAMNNIRERLQGHYGQRYKFEIASRPGIGTAVTIMFGKE